MSLSKSANLVLHSVVRIKSFRGKYRLIRGRIVDWRHNHVENVAKLACGSKLVVQMW